MQGAISSRRPSSSFRGSSGSTTRDRLTNTRSMSPLATALLIRVGRKAHVHVARAAHGDADGFLDFLCQRDERADARMAAVHEAAEMPRVVELRAESRGPVHLVARMVAVGAVAGYLLTGNAHADLYEVGACTLELLGEVLRLFQDDEAVVVAQAGIHFLHGVDERQHGEVGARTGP